MKRFLFLAALVLLILSASPTLAQFGFSELDPNILWVADSSIGLIDGFAVHPNGNIFAYQGSTIYEIDGNNGKLIRVLPKLSKDPEIASFDISKDGKYLAISYEDVVIIDLSDLSTRIIGKGNPVKFTSDSRKVAFGPQSPAKPFEGSDSNIVIVNMENWERHYVKDTESLSNLTFSPDGRFFATGGSGKDLFGKFYTSLKLWDANTLKLIKELEKMENTDFNFERIEFKSNSKLVGFLPYNEQVSIYNTETTTLSHKYDKFIYPFKSFGRFCFINDSLIAFTSITGSATYLLNYFDERIYNVGNFLAQSGLKYSNQLDAIILGTSAHLYAYSLNSILTSLSEDVNQITINAMYSKGNLTVKGILSIGNQVNIEIFDINGKMLRLIKSQTIGNEMRVPLILQRGTYLLNITEGQNQYSAKFLVTE